MASLKLEDLATSMLAAAKAVFDKRWPDIKDYAEPEFEKLARTLIQIEGIRTRKKNIRRQCQRTAGDAEEHHPGGNARRRGNGTGAD